MRAWISYLFELLGLTAAGATVVTGSASASVPAPDASVSNRDVLGHAPLVFERRNYNEGEQFAGHSSHSSHSSHASHSSHSSHYSGSGGGSGYTYEPAPAAPPPSPHYSAPASPAPAPPRATTYLVMIMRLQSRLHDLGYYEGTIDGVLGPATRQALKNFQLVKRLPVTGRMDDATLAALGITY